MHKKREKASYSVQSVVNALKVIECFSFDEGELDLSTIAKRTGINRIQLSKILATLEFRGFIEKDRASEKYKIGLKIFELGEAYRSRLRLFRAARPIMEEVVKRCNETCYIGDLRGEFVVYLLIEETLHPVRAVPRVGQRYWPHASALGKAILAYKSPEEIDKIYKDEKLPTYTANTIKTKEELIKELEVIRERGYATDFGEVEEGVAGVAVPVFDYTTNVIAAFSISGPITRISLERVENELAPLAKEVGKRLSEEMGYTIGLKAKEKIGRSLY